jgi:NAD-dependent DNA ligase
MRAREKIEEMIFLLEDEKVQGENVPKFSKALEEFDTYIAANQELIPSYGKLWRNEETIATEFLESAVNQIASKRFVKRQQMQWSKKRAHLVLQNVLQNRTQMLDGRLEATFRNWYPGFRSEAQRKAG